MGLDQEGEVLEQVLAEQVLGLHPEHSEGEEVKVLEVDQDRVLEEEVEVVASVVEEDEWEEEVGEVEEEVEGIGIQ